MQYIWAFSVLSGLELLICLNSASWLCFYVCITLFYSAKIPVLREPSDALKEAAKIQAHQVWNHSGVLALRSQEYPLEPSVMETVYSGTGMVFEGWSKKVSVFCTILSEHYCMDQ